MRYAVAPDEKASPVGTAASADRTAAPGGTIGPLANWVGLQRQLAEADVDALVATTAANVTYVSDFWGLSQWSRRSAQVFAIALREASRRVCLVVALGNADLIPTDAARAPHRVETYGGFVFA